MKIEITTVNNGLLVTIQQAPRSSDPLAQRPGGGTWFAHDTTDALGRIAEALKSAYDPIVDQLEKH